VHIEEVFKSILDNTQEGAHLQTEEKIGKIVQAMEDYKSHITDLMTLLNPSTPPKVNSQREEEVAGNMENMAQSIKDIAKLYDKSVHNFGQVCKRMKSCRHWNKRRKELIQQGKI
jgi:hypothetical protein